jgi:hypothetical protein
VVHTIYRTWGMHANHYTTDGDVVHTKFDSFTLLYLRRVTDLRVNQAVCIHVLTILRIHIVELLVR